MKVLIFYKYLDFQILILSFLLHLFLFYQWRFYTFGITYFLIEKNVIGKTGNVLILNVRCYQKRRIIRIRKIIKTYRHNIITNIIYFK